MTISILLLPGDGIGPEIVRQAEKLLRALAVHEGLEVELREAPFGGAAVDQAGDPLPAETLEAARAADAVVLGAIGGPKWDRIERSRRPERGILRLRAELGLFANLRPAFLFPELSAASTLRPEVVAGLDLLIVRELTGGIYFGEPRGIVQRPDGEREGFNTLRYRESEIRRVAEVACAAAERRAGRLCSVDKANVLEATELWREVVSEVAAGHPGVALTHMYVDNAAMQLVRAPTQFDVIVTTNLFGDILSDLASMASGSIGMLPSASLGAGGPGLYEPIHGSAPDIAGRDQANPLATLLSLALAFEHSLHRPELAERIRRAVRGVLAQGLRTADIAEPGCRLVGTEAMGDAVIAQLLGDRERSAQTMDHLPRSNQA